MNQLEVGRIKSELCIQLFKNSKLLRLCVESTSPRIPFIDGLNCFKTSTALEDKARISELPGPLGPTAGRLQ